MKKWFLTVLFLLVFGSLAVGGGTITSFTPAGRIPGEIRSTSPELGDFYTFCIERGVPLSNGATYAFTVSSVAESLHDPLSVGSAWLYAAFDRLKRTGEGPLAGLYDTATNQTQLQEAFWWLEQEAVDPINASNPYVELARSALGEDIQADAPEGLFGVYVLNNRNPTTGSDRQDVLWRDPSVPAPDTGTTAAMLGIFLLSSVLWARGP